MRYLLKPSLGGQLTVGGWRGRFYRTLPPFCSNLVGQVPHSQHVSCSFLMPCNWFYVFFWGMLRFLLHCWGNCCWCASLVLAGPLTICTHSGKDLYSRLALCFITCLQWFGCSPCARHSDFLSQATEREIRCLRAWLSVLQLSLPTFSLQSGVSKPRAFNLPCLCEWACSKLSICLLEGFYGNCKGGEERGISGSGTMPILLLALLLFFLAFSLASWPAVKQLPSFTGITSGMAIFVSSWNIEKSWRKLPLSKLLSFSVQLS